jgi:hypothetical protein
VILYEKHHAKSAKGAVERENNPQIAQIFAEPVFKNLRPSAQSADASFLGFSVSVADFA